MTRRGGSIVLVLALAGCKHGEAKPEVDAEPASSSAAPASPSATLVHRLASCRLGTTALAQDADTLYFAEDSSTNGAFHGTLEAVPKSGGEKRTLYDGPELIRAVVPAGKTIFALDRSVSGRVFTVEGGKLAPVPIVADRGPHVVLTNARTDAAVADFDAGFDRIAVDDTSIFVAGEQRGEIGKVPRAGGKLQVLAREAGVTGLALDAANVYFTTSAGAVRRVAKTGGAVTTLASSRRAPHDVVVSSGTIAWVEGSPVEPNEIFVLRAGGAPEKLALPANAKEGRAVALAGDEAFFLSQDAYGLASLARAPLASNGPAKTIPGPIAPTDFVVDGRTAYFIALAGGPGDPTEIVGSVPVP